MAGAGYRVLARLDDPKGFRSSTWDRACLAMPGYKNDVAFEWWIGGGKPLDPYLKGQLFDLLCRRFRVRDIKIDSYRDMADDVDLEFAERTVLLSWMRQWLRLLLAYNLLVSDLSQPLAAFFRLPQVEVLWYRTERDQKKVSLGIAWYLRSKVSKGMRKNLALQESPPSTSSA